MGVLRPVEGAAGAAVEDADIGLLVEAVVGGTRLLEKGVAERDVDALSDVEVTEDGAGVDWVDIIDEVDWLDSVDEADVTPTVAASVNKLELTSQHSFSPQHQ
jgi:hypothetical protein